jgi:hypothetical protein
VRTRPALANGLVVLLLVTFAAGCRPAPTPPPSVATPEPTATAPSPTEIANARRFRQDFGLRADDAWIIAVATAPDADRLTYGVPLTASEVAELGRRTLAIEALKPLVIGYASTQPDYAGAYVDNGRGGILVVQFNGRLDVHRSAIFASVRPGARLEVRQVRWSVADLDQFASRLVGDEAWFRTIPAYLAGYGPNIMANRVEVEISSADLSAPAKIKAHYGWTDEVVIVTSDGTGVLLLPKGTLRITALNAQGRPVTGLACVAISDIDGAQESRPAPMPTTGSDGVCEFEVAATAYTIQLERGSAPTEVVATGRAVVAKGTTARVTIRLK